MSFNFKEVSIPGLLLVEPKVFNDQRGFFFEKYKKSDFDKYGIKPFVQDNYSYSKKGTIRALHYQSEPFAQGKLVSVIKGKIWDVALDLRVGSEYYGQWFGVELSDQNNLSLYIPEGFAHGFSTLSPEVCFMYKCTNEYNADCKKGVLWNDPTLGIDWKVENPILSEKDLKWPKFDQLKNS